MDVFTSQPSTYQTLDFNVAGQIIRLRVPSSFNWQKELISFGPFHVAYDPEVPVCLEAEVRYGPCDMALPERELLSDVSIVWERFLFEDAGDYYVTTVKNQDETERSMMVSEKDFRASTVYVKDSQQAGTAINWLLMVQFGQRILAFGGVLMHASVVEDGKEAYAFLGKSGTGKSTHSRMWLQAFSDFSLLNDDNPVLMIDEDKQQVHIYGTPWSGKTPCYRKDGFPLKGIVRLEQAPENQFTMHAGSQAFLSLMPSGTAIRWNNAIFSRMLDNLQRVSELTRVGYLRCLPDTAAAVLCFQSLQD